MARCWGAVNSRYVAEMKDATRRMMRMVSGGDRKSEFRRKASAPGKNGGIVRGLPTVWMMGHIAGYWKSAAAPMIADRSSRASRRMILNAPRGRPRASGGIADVARNKDAYPDGIPLTPDEVKPSRNVRPKSLEGGEFV